LEIIVENRNKTCGFSQVTERNTSLKILNVNIPAARKQENANSEAKNYEE